ncbi:MAG TPA: hypothetical protein VN688_17520 [Gemmataceae bacterium]|nr:hypothetical protein [Gemmataceae bacterium]
MLIGMVSDTFAIKGRGVVVATDTTYEQLPQDLKLKVGDPIELRNNGVVILRTNVAGLAPWTPKQLFGFLLPRDVSKEDVPVGAEVWTVE